VKNHSKKVCINEKLKEYILIGVVGQPNTGKSSIIKVLFKEKVEDKNGEFKKERNEIRLHKNIALQTNKGLVFPAAEHVE